MVTERIYFDPEFFASLLLKLEHFFFKHYAAYVKGQAVPAGACAVTTACTVLTASTTATSSFRTC